MMDKNTMSQVKLLETAIREIKIPRKVDSLYPPNEFNRYDCPEDGCDCKGEKGFTAPRLVGSHRRQRHGVKGGSYTTAIRARRKLAQQLLALKPQSSVATKILRTVGLSEVLTASGLPESLSRAKQDFSTGNGSVKQAGERPTLAETPRDEINAMRAIQVDTPSSGRSMTVTIAGTGIQISAKIREEALQEIFSLVQQFRIQEK